MATFTDFTLTTQINGITLPTSQPLGLAYYKGFIYTTIIDNNIPYIYKIKFTDGSAPVTENSNGGTNYYQIDSFNNGDEIRQMRVYNQYLYFIYNTAGVNSGKLYRINLETFNKIGDEYQLQINRQLVIDNLNNPQGFVKLGTFFFITCENKIIRWDPSDGATDLLISTDTDADDDIILDSPHGIDTDDSSLFFCNYGTTNKKIYKFEISNPSNIEIITTTTNGKNDGLYIYGKYMYVCANDNTDKKILRFNIKESTFPINIDVTNTYDTLDYRPNQILFVNNKIFYTSFASNKIQTKLFNTDFENGTAFSMSLSLPTAYEYFDNSQYQEGLNTGLDYKTITYTLNNNFTIDNTITWEEVGLSSSKIIIDGNQKTITIDANTDIGTNALFFGGGFTKNNNDKWNNTILEIKNLTVIANQDVMSGLLRGYGYVKITNCRFELNGNILNNCGGLVYNNYGREIYEEIDITISNSSAVINGKIGNNAGPLIGYIQNGCTATINNCYSIVLDNDTDIPRTLNTGAGAFVGSGVGRNDTMSISNSFCIFSGTMAYVSGIIGGKFLGTASGTINISNFYAITNISNYTLGDGTIAQQPYILSCYDGSYINTLTLNLNISNINILHLGTYGSNFKIYDNTTTVNNLNTFTNFNSFNSSANTESAKVGDFIYFLNTGNPTGYKLFSPIAISKGILIGANNNLINTRNLTFNINITPKTGNSINLNTYSSVDPETTIYYTSLNPTLVEISDNSAEMLLAGSASIKAYVNYDEENQLSYGEVTSTFTIETKPSSSLSAFTIENKIIGTGPFTPTLPTIIEGNGNLTYSSSNTDVATINNLTGLITIHGIGLTNITATLSETEDYFGTSVYADFLVVNNEYILNSAANLKLIGITNTVIFNIMNFNIANSAFYNGLLIDFNWGIFNTDENRSIGRHEMLNIIFNINPIDMFISTKEFLGFNDGTNDIKIYKANSTITIIESNYSYYVNLVDNGTSFTLNYLNNTITINKIGDNYVVNGQNYSDGDIINLFKNIYTLHFGGAHIFKIVIPCLTEGTIVLTPNGYVNVGRLRKGDNVITSDNRIVEIVKIYKSRVIGNNYTYPCIIPKNSIGPNYPPETFKISQGHLIRYNNSSSIYWIYPRKYFKLDKSKQIFTYYHIKLENYITDHLVINNGVVVESLGNHPSDKPNNKQYYDNIKESKLRLRKKFNKIKSTKKAHMIYYQSTS